MNLAAVQEWVSATLEFVYPPLCLGCDRPRESTDLLCATCAGTVSFLEYPLCLDCTRPIIAGVVCPSCRPGLPLLALGDHVGPLQQVVIGLKFRHVRRIAPWASSELVARQKSRIDELSPLALVPVPLHSGREYFRGFNQAELLAEHLGEMLDLDVRCDLATREKHRRVQSRLSREKRFKNVRGVFQSLDVSDTVDRILIVDDVVTSGATVGELARILRGAGHSVVGVLAIAHRG